MEFAVQLLAWSDCHEVLPQQPYLIANCVRHGPHFLVVVLCYIERGFLVGGFELAPCCCHCLGPFVGCWDVRSLVLWDFAYCLLDLECHPISAKNRLHRTGLLVVVVQKLG